MFRYEYYILGIVCGLFSKGSFRFIFVCSTYEMSIL